MDDVLAADEAGNLLTAFHLVTEEARFDDGPLPLALTAVWNDERLLLVSPPAPVLGTARRHDRPE
ncbi:hypothetical protein ABZU75_37820 [Streptosporangium sp. NPDC005286]|uniref:hypothetical protein n=1 Tax=Streptosporangium sp. NPDC005286 TaxID=3154463 RepID=UPI0033BCA83F